MPVMKIVGLGLVGAVLAITVKKYMPELALQVSLVAGILLLLMVMEELSQTVQAIRDFVQTYDQGYAMVNHLLKIIGVAYICEFTAQLLQDAGQSAIGTKVELAGKVIILGFSVPLLTQFAQAIMELV